MNFSKVMNIFFFLKKLIFLIFCLFLKIVKMGGLVGDPRSPLRPPPHFTRESGLMAE
jgi:hypothetical protein